MAKRGRPKKSKSKKSKTRTRTKIVTRIRRSRIARKASKHKDTIWKTVKTAWIVIPSIKLLSQRAFAEIDPNTATIEQKGKTLINGISNSIGIGTIFNEAGVGKGSFKPKIEGAINDFTKIDIAAWFGASIAQKFGLKNKYVSKAKQLGKEGIIPHAIAGILDPIENKATGHIVSSPTINQSSGNGSIV